MKLILASASPRRRVLLKRAGVSFKVIPSRIPEHSKHKAPHRLVRDLALQKARAVAAKLKDGVVLGADTVVVLKGKILGKPRDAEDAYRMLYRLGGSTHRVLTGIAVVDVRTKKVWSSHEVSVVRMKKLPVDMLLRLSRKHLDKAGSYAIQEKRDPIAKVIRGSYDNVVGLPVAKVKALLKKLSRAV